MSETLFKFLLSEMDTVRLICRHEDCGAILEVPIKSLELVQWKQCRACGKDFDVTEPNGHSRLKALADAMTKLKEATKVHIQFVLPCKQVCKLNEIG